MKQKILFVCLGNICRSPAAHGVMESIVAREGLQDQITIDSAGTYGGHSGDLPDSRMRSAASRRGYNLTHRARRITEEDFYRFDMIVVMDDMNYENVSRLAPERKYLDKMHRFVEFCRNHPQWSYAHNTCFPRSGNKRRQEEQSQLCAQKLSSHRTIFLRPHY
ncbi:MAG: low molecular weight phosphotyrosine protein phosphatase, partial [Alistipes sp.]|nr:low molecular weight phosphotyrosine protein phosphatase [Alistipes sp.]